jgi:hypothetical protein
VAVVEDMGLVVQVLVILEMVEPVVAVVEPEEVMLVLVREILLVYHQVKEILVAALQVTQQAAVEVVVPALLEEAPAMETAQMAVQELHLHIQEHQ